MNESNANIHTEFHRLLGTEAKEALLQQRGLVVWMYGMSGSGKSTLAVSLERHFHEQGRLTQVLDGDNIRHGINRDLGFSLEDREENIRRISEIAKLSRNLGVITIASFITPTNALRSIAQDIIGTDLLQVYIKASYEACEERDVKGLYAKAKSGEVKQFTGKDSLFEEPDNADLILDTETLSIEEATQQLIDVVSPRIAHS
ncbi:adenylyl-sulfate kinase [Verrucomicrobiales bacterium]|jgi:adenylylsulfate kinase|nr:adenylyl-sulfate kinase [Verrucomicrobiales bacterium]MDB2347788.1 adenylyl-sulfate kinase [Verrucomicrobiales bacterium]MDC0502848.1 adenylyl-sulfate kinase [Verrucomicrobiales bacterium]MDF1786641.1 adenylyl-sulfate kinase [Verrucomicrobiales bacterium]